MSIALIALLALSLPPLLLWLQGRWVRRRVPRLPEASGRRQGVCGTGEGGPLRLLVLGESPAVGVGIEQLHQAMSVQMAEQLAQRMQQPVSWRVIGYSGARVVDLRRQYEGRRVEPADLLLLVCGVNDATALSSQKGYRQALRYLLAALWASNPRLPIVLAGLPPLDTFPALPQPLSAVMGWRSRRLDQVLAELAQNDRRLRHVPCGEVVVDEFAADGFHPDAAASLRWGRELAAAGRELLKNADAGSGHLDHGGDSDNRHTPAAGSSGGGGGDHDGGSD